MGKSAEKDTSCNILNNEGNWLVDLFQEVWGGVVFFVLVNLYAGVRVYHFMRFSSMSRGIWHRVAGFVALLPLLLSATEEGMAQELQPITIEQATPGSLQYSLLLPERLSVLGVLDEGLLLYERDGVYLTTGKGKELLLPFSAVGGEGSFRYLSSGKLAGFVGEDWVVWDYVGRKVLYRFSYDRMRWRHYQPAHSGAYLMLSDGKNMAILYPGGEPQVLTTDGSFDIAYGTSVHRNEFGIKGGLFPSPDDRYVAFYCNDQSRVEEYPIVRMNSSLAYVDPIKYPMAGRASEQVQVGIYDTRSGKVVYLQTGKPVDRFFTNIAWSLDSKRLYIDEVERSQEETHLRAYDVASGQPLGTLLTEENERYIEPQTPICWLQDGSFVRLSRVDGYNHFYHYTAEGKLIRQVTSGQWEVKELAAVDEQKGYLYFISNKDYPIGQDLYRVPIKGGKVERITKDNGWHAVEVSPNGRFAYDAFSNLNTPNRCQLFSLEQQPTSTTLLTAADPLARYYRPTVELGSMPTEEGIPLYYKLTRPATLESGKKYPVVLYVYGGPHSQLVTDKWRGLRMGWDTYMAQQGYVVLTLDNRGTANRGMDFESVIHRQLGTIEMQDQMLAVDYLRSLPYVDSERIGVYGWSFGGFMTTNLMLTYPDVFKVGVAGGPVMNWAYYEVMYGERYMDTPQENPAGYEKNNLIKRASDLKGRLLLIHGGVDPVVLWQHSQLFIQAAVKSGTLLDYMVYPMDEHNVRGQDRVHLHRIICRYFDDHLK